MCRLQDGGSPEPWFDGTSMGCMDWCAWRDSLASVYAWSPLKHTFNDQTDSQVAEGSSVAPG